LGQKERLIPFLDEQVIKSSDRSAQRIEVDWDPGF
ncbi:ribosome maturation factor RimM, partial [Vibrio natriegens]